MNNPTFLPMYASHPGQTVRDLLDNRGMSPKELAIAASLPIATVKGVIEGRVDITPDIALHLSKGIGGAENFWLARQSQYQDALIRLQKAEEENREWISRLPLGDMVKQGWIKPATNSLSDKIRAALAFFKCRSADQWYEEYEGVLSATAFRTSQSFDSVPESVICWLQQGRLLAERIVCANWSRKNLEAAVPKSRTLSRIEDPSIFLPKLQELLASCGVALVIVKTPSKCHASGAVLTVSPTKKMLILSFRHLTDDHFWFSLFHEIGHLVLHDPQKMFLECDGETFSDEETEANEYSAKVLIPDEYREELLRFRAKDWKQIMRFAKKIGISPGIVVGQLQHNDILNHGQLEKLKNRYKWN